MGLTELTRKHGIKILVDFAVYPISVEDCSLAVGRIVGHNAVKSAARMNKAVVIFLDTVENVERVVNGGIDVGYYFLFVQRLSIPEVKVTVSNVPPFISDKDIKRELSKYGEIVSDVRKVPSECKSPLLRHVVSHKRQLLMVLKDKSKPLNVVFVLRVDDFDYVIYAATDDFKCFSCGKMGHQRRACPEKKEPRKGLNQKQKQKEFEDRRKARGLSESQEMTEEEEEEEEESESQGEEEEEITGAQEVRGEEANGAQEVREKEASGTQEVREKEASGTQEVREKEASGTQEVREEGISEAQKVGESTGGQVETGTEVDMEGDEQQLKAPQLKRKKGGHCGSSQAKKVATKGSGGAAECESSLKGDAESSLRKDSEPSLEEDSEPSLEEGSESSLDEDADLGPEEDAAANSEPPEHRAGSSKGSEGYSVEKIQDYLRRSKHVRGARVEDYLSDKEKLSSSAKAHMKSKDKGGLTIQEGFRLKKIVQIIRKERNNDGAK